MKTILYERPSYLTALSCYGRVDWFLFFYINLGCIKVKQTCHSSVEPYKALCIFNQLLYRIGQKHLDPHVASLRFGSVRLHRWIGRLFLQGDRFSPTRVVHMRCPVSSRDIYTHPSFRLWLWCWEDCWAKMDYALEFFPFRFFSLLPKTA